MNWDKGARGAGPVSLFCKTVEFWDFVCLGMLAVVGIRGSCRAPSFAEGTEACLDEVKRDETCDDCEVYWDT